jgi:signal transduction histidine kinase
MPPENRAKSEIAKLRRRAEERVASLIESADFPATGDAQRLAHELEVQRIELELQNEELRRLAAQNLTLQENERRRIAADLHDGLGQSLSLLKLAIQEADRQMEGGAPKKAAETVKNLIPKVAAALDELRRVSMDLHPSILDDLGILPTLSWFTREFEFAHRKTRIEKEIGVSESDVPKHLRIAIFRILQEAVENAVKHANAECIKISLHRNADALAFSIEDDGKGFDTVVLASRREERRDPGVQRMRDRVELTGGTYALSSAPGQGTKVCAWWPAGEASRR